MSVGKHTSYTLSGFSVRAQEHCWRKPGSALAHSNTLMLASSVLGLPTTIPIHGLGIFSPTTRCTLFPPVYFKASVSFLYHSRQRLPEAIEHNWSHILHISSTWHLSLHWASLSFHLLRRHVYHHLSDFQFYILNLRSLQKSNTTLPTFYKMSPCLVPSR